MNVNKKFRNKYRVESIRLKNYDYSANGVYFITICTKNRKNFFGKIVGGKMVYSPIGVMAKKYWQQIIYHFNFVLLDEFIIMPDHVHGIIWVNKSYMDNIKNVNQNQNVWVETRHGASLQMFLPHKILLPKQTSSPQIQGNKFGKLKNDSLQSIINHYKGAVKHYANKNNIPFFWQKRYYEHIINNYHALNRIRRYIKNNPLF
jgi:REP element-mobilizing transposase RayT